MPLLVIETGELTGHIIRAAEARVIASFPAGHNDGRPVVIDEIHVFYHVLEPASDVIPNIDPWCGYKGTPNGEGAHPHDDATGHVGQTHEDFSPRPEKRHITDLPSWGGVGC